MPEQLKKPELIQLETLELSSSQPLQSSAIISLLCSKIPRTIILIPNIQPVDTYKVGIFELVELD